MTMLNCWKDLGVLLCSPSDTPSRGSVLRSLKSLGYADSICKVVVHNSTIEIGLTNDELQFSSVERIAKELKPVEINIRAGSRGQILYLNYK